MGRNTFDVIILDAFSGDAVPVHLLTREAFELYRMHMKPDGALAVHASSRYFDLVSLIFRQADAVGMRGLMYRHRAGIDETRGTYQSDVLDHHSLSPKKLNYLKAFLNQIDSLAETDVGRLPVSVSKHLYQTGLVERGGSTEVYVDLYKRYRREWLAFVTKAKLNGCQWANLIDLPPKAA